MFNLKPNAMNEQKEPELFFICNHLKRSINETDAKIVSIIIRLSKIDPNLNNKCMNIVESRDEVIFPEDIIGISKSLLLISEYHHALLKMVDTHLKELLG